MHSFKKAAAVIAVAGVMFPALAFAQSATSTTSIQALIDQLRALQVQILAAQQQQQAIFGQLAVTLNVGSRGENVRQLQQLLAQDPTIFPEGTVTGFFGKLTSEAVKRFQKKHGLDQVGNVGPRTLKKLNEIFGHNGTSTKDHEDGDEHHGKTGTSTNSGGGHDGDDNDDNDDSDDLDAAAFVQSPGETTLCHRPGKSNETIFVAVSASFEHIGHGDTTGACVAGTATTTTH